MTVIETTKATGPSASPHPSKIERTLTWFTHRVFPLANPDFEDVYPRVCNWWVEINAAGVPQRELGFDDSREMIVAGPIGRNMGFWTDSAMVFEVADYQVVPNDEFESAWLAYEASHPNLADGDA
jgi:hypothetical protein